MNKQGCLSEHEAHPELNDDVFQNSPEQKQSSCPFSKARPIWLKNQSTNQELYDTLHSKTSQRIQCGKGEACLGAFMAGQSSARQHGVFRTQKEVWEHAQTFMKDYYEHLENSTPAQLSARLAQIEAEIEREGTYELTIEEITYGARVAWRNAARCIARIFWNNLEIFDYRHVTSTKEMYDALMKHVEWATNNGNIRTGLTLFPQRRRGREDFRLWNSQFILYAGYQLPDGTIVGDAGKIEFTKLCERLGWKGRKETPFDVLPLILNAPGEGGPRLYEIPPELILEVPFEHPKLKWFEELGLKWYALPAVADMLLDIGGVEFTCAPFNGWYTGAEIGCRNLCDTNRYNMLEIFAEKMGLDTSTEDNLWKDKVAVQVNIAVLHSYQKCGVSIVDHHSAAESFMKFMEQEQRARGGCNADWVWLVPPMSGSTVPTFHQDMLNYNMKPSYEYQPRGWEHCPYLKNYPDEEQKDNS